jgi:hypothetical protein
MTINGSLLRQEGQNRWIYNFDNDYITESILTAILYKVDL